MEFPDTDKGADGLFWLTCKYGHVVIVENTAMLAMVMDQREEYDLTELKEAVKTEADGVQIAYLKVVSEDGGFNVMAKTAGARGPKLEPGDLVLWVPKTYVNKLSTIAPDKRFGWVGFIVAKVNLPTRMDNPFKNITRFEL